MDPTQSQDRNLKKQLLNSSQNPLIPETPALNSLDTRNVTYPDHQFQDYQGIRSYVTNPYMENRMSILSQPNVYNYDTVDSIETQDFHNDGIYFEEKGSTRKRPSEKHIVPPSLSDIFVQMKRPKQEDVFPSEFEETYSRSDYYPYPIQVPVEPQTAVQNCFSILVNPADHQVKEFNLLPPPALLIHGDPSASDYVVVYLIPDIRLEIEPIFLAAQSAKFCKDRTIHFENLKITNKMLKGRTKGYKFHLRFDYYSKFNLIERLPSESFLIWTNVNQKGFPRETRDSYLKNQWKDAKYPIDTD